MASGSSSATPPKTKTTRTRKAAGTAKTSKAAKTVKGVSPAAGITNYTTAMRWLFEHVDHERMRIVPYNQRTFSLDRMRKLLDLLGNPHQQIKTVHVAGTKGKGSTCAMLASMLQACGYAVGLYTSPHLVDLRERIVINGEIISYPEATEAFRQVAEVEPAMGEDAPLSFFEIVTAAAFKHFAQQAVDVAVIEVGLGGRLDCTNVIEPLVCGITQISHDHMSLLGRKLPEIAREKAGIFKKDVPVISVEQDPEVAAVLDEVADEVGASLQFTATGSEIDFSYRFEANRELGPHTRVSITTATSRFEHLPVPLRGEHQALNCGLALAMLDKLKACDFNLPEEQVIAGLAQTRLAGRMEQVWAEPRVIVDGAHNGASIHALVRALGAHVAYDSLVMIFGCAQDKDINGMLKQVALGADKVIFTRAKANPRACEAEDLMTRFADISGKMAQCANSLDEALRLAARAVSREDLIVVTGSFYLAGEAKKFFDDHQAKRRTGR